MRSFTTLYFDLKVQKTYNTMLYMFVHFILVTANLIIYLCIKITSTLPATEVSIVNHIRVSDEKDQL